MIWYFDRSFDRRFKTNTSGEIGIEKLYIESNNRQEGYCYEPSPTNIFMYIMKNLIIEYKDFIFIDMGSGKGRALLLASNFPFREIIGIEFSDILHRIAQNNICIYKSKNQKCFNIKSLCIDAVDYQFPNEHVVLYLYNPFREKIMSKVFDNIKKSIAKNHIKIVVIYYAPFFPHLIEECGFLNKKKEIQLPWDYTREQQSKSFLYFNY